MSQDSITKGRLAEIAERLSGVVGKPWIYEPEHRMFMGTTNALNIYYGAIDLGRNEKVWEPCQDERLHGHRLTKSSVEQMARVKALGQFLERSREDMQFLMGLCNPQPRADNSEAAPIDALFDQMESKLQNMLVSTKVQFDKDAAVLAERERCAGILERAAERYWTLGWSVVAKEMYKQAQKLRDSESETKPIADAGRYKVFGLTPQMVAECAQKIREGEENHAVDRRDVQEPPQQEAVQAAEREGRQDR
jgi:hypothetical protein